MNPFAIQSNDLSYALVELEVQAMNAVKGVFLDDEGNYTIQGEPDRNLAMSLVFGAAYNDDITKSAGEVLTRFAAIDSGVKTVSLHEQNILLAMEEQEVGGRQVLEAVARLKEITLSVQQSSGDHLVKESHDLMKISKEAASGIGEMAAGINQINVAVTEINDLSQESASNISELKEETHKFNT